MATPEEVQLYRDLVDKRDRINAEVAPILESIDVLNRDISKIQELVAAKVAKVQEIRGGAQWLELKTAIMELTKRGVTAHVTPKEIIASAKKLVEVQKQLVPAPKPSLWQRIVAKFR